MRVFGALILAVCLAGCAQQQLPLREAEPTDVPFTAMLQTKHRPIHAAQVLSGDDAEEFTARADRGANGPLVLWALSTYNTFTYDAERISSQLQGSGFRYRMLWQQAVVSPVSP